MKERIFEETAFDRRKIYELDYESVKIVSELTGKRIAGQLQALGSIRQRITTIIGWLVAIVVALAGVSVSEMRTVQVDFVLVFMALYGVIAASAVIFHLVRTMLYKVYDYTEGASPSYLLTEETVGNLREVTDKARFILGWNLAAEQEKIMKNDKEIMREVCAYRRALKMIVCSIAGSIPFIVVLLLLF